MNIEKQIIFVSDDDLACRIQDGIQEKAGIALPKVQFARDLEIDGGFGKRKRTPTAKGRMLKRHSQAQTVYYCFPSNDQI